MQLLSFTSIVLASWAFQKTAALPEIQKNNNIIAVAQIVQQKHPEAYAAFQNSSLIILGATTQKRQEVPGDGNPDPNRPPVIPDNIFLLQCSEAGFLGECLSWGAPPGRCVNYSSFNKTRAFLDKYENQTTSLSSNNGGLCQFYKFINCNNKGDDRGVSMGYNYNLAVADNGYSGDYDKQISSCKCS
ncbi:hypothetical protein CORC01_00578 [Colletotrichum orchidophilum]|uniref:Secreted protein n=1 Tax=Colletotrichum orchidophilum TaxID=1209926 RepID=A0A1G4BS21_9PEZI|nr:uncharacterized protein CORC01_00578 [Colletotrichum orchidophilum]OHF04239.1 hypothetical protein CORC01_00578 [Colletotrichum orchidophilum]